MSMRDDVALDSVRAAWETRVTMPTSGQHGPRAAPMPRMSVVIPTPNEARNLPHVLARLPAGVYEVIFGYSTGDAVAAARALSRGPHHAPDAPRRGQRLARRVRRLPRRHHRDARRGRLRRRRYAHRGRRHGCLDGLLSPFVTN